MSDETKNEMPSDESPMSDAELQEDHERFRVRDNLRVNVFMECAKALTGLQGESWKDADAMIEARARVLHALDALMLPTPEREERPIDRLLNGLADAYPDILKGAINSWMGASYPPPSATMPPPIDGCFGAPDLEGAKVRIPVAGMPDAVLAQMIEQLIAEKLRREDAARAPAPSVGG